MVGAAPERLLELSIMLVLALDTSTPAIAAGVVELLLPHELMTVHREPAAAADPVQVLAEDAVVDAFGHAEKLLPLVTAVLARAGRSLAQLDAVVVGLGPGPFTGLRVGIVTAASLGDALGIAVHGVPSHDGIALSVTASVPAPEAQSADGADTGAAGLLVVTDARRREVYVSGYAPPPVLATGAGAPGPATSVGRRVFGPAVLTPAAVAEHDQVLAVLAGTPHGQARVTGPGVALVPSLQQYVLVEPGSAARGLVLAAARELLTGAVPGPLVPLYLRRPDVTEPAAPKSTLNHIAGVRR